MKDKYLTVIMLSALLGIAVYLYYPTFEYGLVWDDHDILYNVPEITGESHWTNAFRTPVDRLYRPLRSISLHADNTYMQVPFGYHFTNVMLFAAACGAFYFMARCLLGNSLWAFCAALLYAVHPVHAEIVSWVTGGRANLLAAPFVFASIALYISAVRRGDGGADADMNMKFAGLSWAAFTLALLSKESAIIVPCIIFIYEIIFSGKDVGLTKIVGRAIRGTLPFVLIAGTYFFVRTTYVGITGQFNNYHGGSQAATLISMIPVFADYARMLIAPLRLCPVYAPEIYHSVIDHGVLLPAAGLSAMIIAAVALWRRAPMISFAIGWFFITLLPVSNLIPIASMKAVRFLTLPAAGACILMAYTAGAVVGKLTTKRNVAGAAVLLITVLLSLFYANRAIEYRNIWRDDLSLWSAGAVCAAESHIAHNNLGRAYYDMGMREEAAAEFEKAVALMPGFPTIRRNLAQLYASLGRFEEAHKHYEALVLQNSFDAENTLPYISMKLRLGREREAIVVIDRLVSHPELPENLRKELLRMREKITAAGK